MIVKAHAKINLSINVLSRLPNGYHEVDMVMLPLDLHDSIDISVLPPNATATYVTCDDFSLVTDEYNLVSITIRKMREKYGFKQNFRVHIHKLIPMSAGLGGGSADAAAVIKAVCELLKIKPSKQDMIDLARSIGSDVPFCLFNVPARVGGIGEQISPITVKNKYWVLILKPEEGLSTKTVFNKLNDTAIINGNNDAVIAALAQGSDELLPDYINNALEVPSMLLLPKIRQIKEMLKSDGFLIVLMSGSGSSVFALSTNQAQLAKAQRKYEKMGLTTVLTKIK